MPDSPEAIDLSGKMLIAMPSMGDPRFSRSVILVCTHSDEGAMGLIINKPAKQIRFKSLLKQLGIDAKVTGKGPTIGLGGPVENARGFVLHSDDYQSEETTMDVPGGFAMTSTQNILADIANGIGPEKAKLALGYSGWGPGQLEQEIQDNGWLVCDADEDLIFGLDDAGKWNQALGLLGINPLMLSATGGRA